MLVLEVMEVMGMRPSRQLLFLSSWIGTHELSPSPPAVLHPEARLHLMDESTPIFPSPFQGSRDALEQIPLLQNPSHPLFSVLAWLRRGLGPRLRPRVGLGLQELLGPALGDISAPTAIPWPRWGWRSSTSQWQLLCFLHAVFVYSWTTSC